MLAVTVYKNMHEDGNCTFEAKGVVTGTQKGRNGADAINDTGYYSVDVSIKLLANRLVTFLKIMAEEGRWMQHEDGLEITFPGHIKIFHPLSGVTRTMHPFSNVEVRELWTHIIFYTNRKKICFD